MELAIRKTRKYVGTYRHLDDWEEVGTVRVIAEKSVTDEDAPEEYTETTKFVCVEVDDPQPLERVEQALRDAFSSHGCAHEYDCCGCWSSYVSQVEHLKGNLYKVIVGSSRNY